MWLSSADKRSCKSPVPGSSRLTHPEEPHHWVERKRLGQQVLYSPWLHTSVTGGVPQSSLLFCFFRGWLSPRHQGPSPTFLKMKGLSSHPNQAQLFGELQGPTISVSRVVKREIFGGGCWGSQLSSLLILNQGLKIDCVWGDHIIWGPRLKLFSVNKPEVISLHVMRTLGSSFYSSHRVRPWQRRYLDFCFWTSFLFIFYQEDLENAPANFTLQIKTKIYIYMAHTTAGQGSIHFIFITLFSC